MKTLCILIFALLLACGESDPSVFGDTEFDDVEYCTPCVGTDKIVAGHRYLDCRPTIKPISRLDEDLIGTWFPIPQEQIDHVFPIVQFKAEGRARWILRPAEDSHDTPYIQTRTWSTDGDALTYEQKNGTDIRLGVETFAPGYIAFEEIDGYRPTPWVRVECTGFGVENQILDPPANTCAECNANEKCGGSDYPVRGSSCLPDSTIH